MVEHQHNALILQSVLRYKQITRAQLCEILQISPGAIVKYIKPLLESGILMETSPAESSKPGRKATFLEFNPDRGVIIGCTLERTKVEAGLVTTSGDVISKRSYPYNEQSPKDELLSLIYTAIENALSEIESLNTKAIGIGVSLGGQIDAEQGVSLEYLFAKGWYKVPLRNLIQERFHLNTYLVKDTNASTLGEQFFGEGIGVSNFLTLWLGTGVGLGIVIDGAIYSGASGFAGEFGHMQGPDGSKLCYCGKHGCLETAVAQETLLERSRQGLDAGVMSSMRHYCEDNPQSLTIEHMIQAANGHDRLACGIFEDAGEIIGNALAGVANLLNPSLILLRGPVVTNNTFLYDTIKRTVLTNSLKYIANAVEIRYTTEECDIQLKGLCALTLNGLIADSTLLSRTI